MAPFADMPPARTIARSTAIGFAVLIGHQFHSRNPGAMLIEISTFLSVNYLVGRPRPDVSKIGPIPGTYSFPSGHIAATVVCWFGAALLLYAFGHLVLSRVVSAVAALVTVMTGWGRVYLGMHHTIDVVVGLALGVTALAIAVKALNMDLQHHSRHTLTVPQTVSM